MKINKLIPFIILITTGTISGFSQELVSDTITTDSISIDTIGNDSIPAFIKTDNVEVIKAFEAQLQDAEMLGINPSLPEIIPVNKEYNYDVTIVPYDIVYPDPVIKPVAMSPDPPIEKKNLYIKGGYGNLKNGFLDLNASHAFSDILEWELAIDHDSGDNTNNIENQKYHNTSLSTGLGFAVFETSKLEFDLFGSLDQRYFYYNDEERTLDISNLDLSRDIVKIGGQLQFYNSFDNTAKVDYHLMSNFQYTDLSDLEGNEVNIQIHADASKRTNSKMAFTFSGGTDINQYMGHNDVIGLFDPYLMVSGDKARFQLGLDYIYANEKSYVFPEAEINYSIDRKILQAFVGVSQDFERLNQRNISEINPFATHFDSTKTTILKDFYGGVRGNILGLVYNAKGGYKQFSNHGIYNIDFQDSLRRVGIGSADVDAVYISGSIEAPILNMLTVGGAFTQNFYSNVSTEELWHIPNLELNAYATLRLLDNKVSVRSELFLRDGVLAQTPDGKENLDDLIDLNIELNLMPVENIGIYARANNIFDKNYRRWLGYQNFGIHFQGGIIANF